MSLSTRDIVVFICVSILLVEFCGEAQTQTSRWILCRLTAGDHHCCVLCSPSAMASAASPKRMVSSVFITLAPPYRATVTQQQSALQARSTPARDPQRTAAQVGPGEDDHFTRLQRGDRSKTESLQGQHSRGRPGTGPSAKVPPTQRPPEVNRGKPQRQNPAAGTWTVCGSRLEKFPLRVVRRSVSLSNRVGRRCCDAVVSKSATFWTINIPPTTSRPDAAVP